MRITNNYIYRQSVEGLAKANERYFEVNRKITEQSEIVKPSDDPVGVGQLLQYEASNLLIEQYSKNATLAKNRLEYQHASLDSLKGFLDKMSTLTIQAENSANDQVDLNAIAEELESLVFSAADLMNSKGSDGKYVFAGFDSDNPPFQKQTDGSYLFKGDEGIMQSQLSETVTIDVSNSGKELFEAARVRNDFTGAVTAGAATLVQMRVEDQGAFDTFVDANYDAITPANNRYTLTTVAGVPDTFSVADSSGTVLSSGEYVSGQPMVFLGMEVSLDGAAGSSVDLDINPPSRDNILNQMNDFIGTLRDSSLTIKDKEFAFRNASVSIKNTLETMGIGKSAIGARLNTISQVESYSSIAKITNQSAQNAISGLDLPAASAELALAQQAIDASQLLFSRVTNLSLFNVL
ncbi:flagellar hook-associated protein FlgL [Marinomonas sp. 15G1-11]|uniref:Flagellar hook-associated protein FlgL n=1 Tax=Marinomonas phaeophyticola TaxID=3004091 RepID=A0ABT4JSF0_9GAMM|nr:flagellar hook-associated protein FlgL [Marinomonas sp. 15G1-11]MCZ2721201.1 flagellar hook-associated protein FlgL [Marinomonas sp. 15G1-11]